MTLLTYAEHALRTIGITRLPQGVSLILSTRCLVFSQLKSVNDTFVIIGMGRVSVRKGHILLDQFLDWLGDSIWKSTVTDGHLEDDWKQEDKRFRIGECKVIQQLYTPT